jgi:hypothetical protein
MWKILVLLLVLFVLFFLTPKISGYSYTDFLMKGRLTDQQVEVASVADIASTSGACGIRPSVQI